MKILQSGSSKVGAPNSPPTGTFVCVNRGVLRYTGSSTGREDRECGGRRLHCRPTRGEIPGDTASWHVDVGSNQRIADFKAKNNIVAASGRLMNEQQLSDSTAR